MRNRSRLAGECQVRTIHGDDVTRARNLLHDASTYVGFAGLFGALADPTRARIVHILLRQEMCTCDLAAVLGCSESSVSQHLRLLRSLRLVRQRRAGKVVYYSLDDAHVAQLVSIGMAHEGHTMGDELLAGASPATPRAS